MALILCCDSEDGHIIEHFKFKMNLSRHSGEKTGTDIKCKSYSCKGTQNSNSLAV